MVFKAEPKQNRKSWYVIVPTNVIKAEKLKEGDKVNCRIDVPPDPEDINADTAVLPFNSKVTKWGNSLAVLIKVPVIPDMELFFKTIKTPLFSVKKAVLKKKKVRCPHCRKLFVLDRFSTDRAVDPASMPTIH